MIPLEPKQLGIVLDTLRTFVPERRVLAFGSRVFGTAKPYSDLDIAILGTEPLSLSTLGSLRDAFSESDLPFRVDIVDWATTSDVFRKRIEEHAIQIFPATSQAD